MNKISALFILILGTFLFIKESHSQINSNCDYNWDLLETEYVIVQVQDLFSSNDSNAIINVKCLEPLIKKMKTMKQNRMFLSFRLYNESSTFKKINLHFNQVLYEYFISKGINEDDIFKSFSSPLELPPPIIKGELLEIETSQEMKNSSYFAFSLEINKE